jgi:hypothetical protein
MSIGSVYLRHDDISFKHATSAPAADIHDDAFGDPSTAQITSGGAAQIVEEQPRAQPLALGRFADNFMICPVPTEDR